MTALLRLISVLLPWPLRRWALQNFFGYQIHPTARIRFAWVYPKKLVMEAGAEIGTFTVCKNLDLIHMRAESHIGRGNWITGFPSGPSRHFAHEQDRKPELILGEHAAITNRHLIDCTNRVVIGQYTTFAGFQSQILTHSIDLTQCRQSSAPVTIGEFCFIGTNCVILGGSTLPSNSALAAKSLLNRSFERRHVLYGGVPAQQLKELSEELHYFHRTNGMVD